ncbi:hypothetical protein GCM10009720_12490 [Yaniella flava]|uniref:Antitoxin VbhA domain-containing protein n=1 Tax=Yaniella flava TaxID=287930 RepID=A0ABN2UDN3_9MICC|nr:antitoxin VbhA family protein [Micrococcaceae bacterium]
MSTPALRAQWVEEADHSVYLEGLTASSEYKANADQYIAGEISADELVKITRSRYGLE